MITIDGSFGEGGGQILRSSLALSLLTTQPFRIKNIRARRNKPGLMRQHLTAVNAATEISNAQVEGAELHSTELTFCPGVVRAGNYHFAVGTAGSATLVLQTVLPALLTASDRSTLVLEGGTHNPYAPPFDFLAKAYLPWVNQMGPRVEAQLEKPGFYPAGGGRFKVMIQPTATLSPFQLVERGELQGQSAQATVANLSPQIAERELKVVQKKLNWPDSALEAIEVKNALGPGNVLLVELKFSSHTEIFSGFGDIRLSAETVASKVVGKIKKYLKSSAPVGEYLADQLVLLLAIAQGGAFRATHLSHHTLTNIEVIQQFLPVQIQTETIDRHDHWIRIETRNKYPTPPHGSL